MKRLYKLLLALLLVPAALPALAQNERMFIYGTDGTKLISLAVSEIDSVTFTESKGGGETETHKYVDLGLPSGLLWAECNVGAETASADGYYFGWGETEPNAKITEASAKWHNVEYPYAELAAEDDAATVLWGSPWRTPTKDDVAELLSADNTTNTWTDDYNGTGVAGRIVKSVHNGNEIFFPAAGIMYNGNAMGKGSYCMYWTSTPYYVDGMTTFINQCAYNLTGVGSGQGLAGTYGFRSDGCNVRAVRAGK